MKNTKGELSKNKIIEESAKLFYKNGYTNTGISDILRATNLPKGSFYFHFKRKDELAINVCYYFEEKLKSWFLTRYENGDFVKFIEGITEDMIEGSNKSIYYGCPLTTLAQELANSHENISKYYYESLNKVIDLFSYIAEKSGINKDKCDSFARQIFAMYEGYLVYFRISKDRQVLINMKNDLINFYNNNK